MKIIANDYTPQDIVKIIREWTELSQKDFGKSINRSERSVQAFELGERNVSLQTLIQIANKHNIAITIEKKEK